MSDILNYRFYLNFKNDDSFGKIEITECVGMDGSSFSVEQDNARFGRDVYKFNEEINLIFYKGEYDPTINHLQLPNGTVVYNLTMGFEFLMEYYNKYAFESDIDITTELDDVVFIPSNLDFVTSETDNYSYFSCRAVQVQDKQQIKRRSDIVTDIFSTEDLDGNPVTPAQTTNILQRAKPEVKFSKWIADNRQSTSVEQGGGANYFFNGFVNQTNYGIENSLVPLENVCSGFAGDSYFNYIEAIEDLTDVVLKIEDANINVEIADSFFNPVTIDLGYSIQDTTDEQAIHEDYVFLETFGFTPVSLVGLNREYSLPDIPAGKSLYISFYTRSGQNRPYNFLFSQGSMSVTTTSTAVSTVIKGVRLIDVYKENLKRINGFDVYAPRFDVGGEYYDQYMTTGNLIKQRLDSPFSVVFKDIHDDLLELCCDYQTIDGKNFIGHYSDFYPNKEIGAFMISPFDTDVSGFNERYVINEFSFGYDTFEQDDSQSNTTDSIHTDSQWLPSNKKVENIKEVKIKAVRDAAKFEKMRKDSYKETTSTSDDDKRAILDVVPLSPTERGGFNSSMTHAIDENGRVRILKPEQLPSWLLIGTSVGGDFNIDDGFNTGSYIVYEIDDSVITLTPVSPPTQSEQGIIYTELSFPYTNVSLVNRTNEGLVYFENLLNGDNYANLKYSIKRNMETWKPYLATASINPDGQLKNTYFKSNGECITRFEWETENVKENESIANIDLGDAILKPNIHERKLLIPFKDMVRTIDAMNTINEDDTIGGFIRCQDVNDRVYRLYNSKLYYVPSTETATLTGEEKYDGSGLTIETSSDIITINRVGYNIEDLSDPIYEMDGDYLEIYDDKKMLVVTPIRFDEVTVNGQTFESKELLMDALINN